MLIVGLIGGHMWPHFGVATYVVMRGHTRGHMIVTQLTQCGNIAKTVAIWSYVVTFVATSVIQVP